VFKPGGSWLRGREPRENARNVGAKRSSTYVARGENFAGEGGDTAGGGIKKKM